MSNNRYDLSVGRISQKEAMQYVNISVWRKFETWIILYKVPFSQQGKQKMFRKEALYAGILKAEQDTLNSLYRQ